MRVLMTRRNKGCRKNRAIATALALTTLVGATAAPAAQEQVLGTYDAAIDVLREQLAAGQLIGVAVEAADQRICEIDRAELESATRKLLRGEGLNATTFTGDGPVLTVTALSLPLTRRRGTARQLLGCAITATVLVGVNVVADGRLLVALVANSTKTWVIGTGSPSESLQDYLADVSRALGEELAR